MPFQRPFRAEPHLVQVNEVSGFKIIPQQRPSIGKKDEADVEF